MESPFTHHSSRQDSVVKARQGDTECEVVENACEVGAVVSLQVEAVP